MVDQGAINKTICCFVCDGKEQRNAKMWIIVWKVDPPDLCRCDGGVVLIDSFSSLKQVLLGGDGLGGTHQV